MSSRKPPPPTVFDHVMDEDDYRAILERARQNCRDERDAQFVYDMECRFDAYGMRAYLSDGQYRYLTSLAERRP